MKILHVYKDFYPPVRGGMEKHIALNCRYQRQWAEVSVLSCSRSLRTQTVDRDGTQVKEVGEWGRFQSAPFSPTFPLHLRRSRADVVVVHVPNPTAVVAWLVARPRGKLVVRYHSDIVRQASAKRFYGPIQMHFLRQAAMILPTSDQYVASSSVLSQLPDRCQVVPLGIIPEEFSSPDPERVAGLADRYGGEYVLFSGRHRYYKGLEYLVRAAGAIDAPVVIAGDGPEHESLTALARELNVDIAFPGALSHDELVDHLHGCAVFAFPSCERSEAFGISMMEAQACGKPIVATRLGTGVEYVNVHGETGLNVPPRDPRALAEAINELLADADRRRRMGETARERMYRDFNAEHVARVEFDLYRGLVEEG
ncbi:MAG: glycosyltransferase [bacterium]|nr:glycosyltransferase [bacterium]